MFNDARSGYDTKAKGVSDGEARRKNNLNERPRSIKKRTSAIRSYPVDFNSFSRSFSFHRDFLLELYPADVVRQVFSEAETTLLHLAEKNLLVLDSVQQALGQEWDTDVTDESVKLTPKRPVSLTAGEVDALNGLLTSYFANIYLDEVRKREPPDSVDALHRELTRMNDASVCEAKLLALLRSATDDSNRYIPILAENQLVSPEPLLPEKRVAQLVLSRFPVPVVDASWEQVLDFRADEENRRRMLALRQWMNKVSKLSVTPAEIEEELEHLLAEHTRALKLHKLRYQYDRLEVAVLTTLEILENVIKLNWSTAARKLFDIRRRDVDFLIHEGDLPGKEVAYLSALADVFQLPIT